MSALLLNNLGVVCPSCDFLNPVGAPKCASCQASTLEAAKAEAAAPSPAPAAAAAPASLADTTMPPSGSATVPPGLKRAASGSSPAAEPARPAVQAPPPAAPAAPAAAAPAPAAPAGPKFGLNVLAGPARGQKFRIGANGAQIGRSKGVVLFPDDPFVSPLHASVVVRDGKVFVKDEGGASGVYVSISGQETINPGTYFCAGLRLFRFKGALDPAPPFVPGKLQVYGAPVPSGQTNYCVEEILLGNRPGKATITSGPTLTIGKAKCDMTYAEDEALAPRHCEVSPMPNGATIRDLSGPLGTYVRISGERQLQPGERIRVGQQTLQLEAVG